MNKKFYIGLLIILVIAVLAGYFLTRKSNNGNIGAISPSDVTATNFTEITTSNGILVGTLGTGMAQILNGTCNIPANASVAATSTANFDCAVSNVQSGDRVFASLAASTTIASQYVIRSVQASTTAGFITFTLLNLTGTAAVPSATNGFGSTTAYYIVR